jgi:multimeric flavodoxin WrbA
MNSELIDKGEKMKILVLNGSPKKKSDTFRLTDAFLKGLNRNNEHEIRVIDVINKKISPCRGCFGCWQKLEGHCVIVDDQNEILDLYRDSDIIIWSFPLYCYGMPSHLKAVLDRTIPLVKMKMVQLPDGTVRHEALADFSKIHTVVISGCGFPDWEGNFDALKLMCKNCFGNLSMVCVPETPMLNVPEAAIVADPLLDRFRKAGEEYEATLTLSAETIAELERPMISAEDYIRNVNRN